MAFSGGADSTALLIGLVQLYAGQQQVSVRALHFNHRIHPDADVWQQHCETLCNRYDIGYQSGIWYQSPGRHCKEGAAREARYEWLSAALQDEEILLTAHHADDQAETVLLNLLQGRGLHRLGGIPVARGLADYPSLVPEAGSHPRNRVVRPLLNFSHKSLCDFLAGQEISWIDDPANHQVDHRRSFLRQEVLPVIRQQFANCDTALIHSAAQFLQANQTLEQLAGVGLKDVVEIAARRTFCLAPPMRLDQLDRQPGLMQPRIIRRWIHNAGLVAPTDKQLGELIRQLYRFTPNQGNALVADSALNGTSLRWADYCIVVYGEWLYLIDQVDVDRSRVEPFTTEPAVLPGNLEARLVRRNGAGLSMDKDYYPGLEWRWRQGGEQFHPPGAASAKSLKKLFQDSGIPEFERRQLPFLCQQGELLWVHGIGFSALLDESEFRAPAGESYEPALIRCSE